MTTLVRKAARKARKFIGRIVYVVRDSLRKMHFVLVIPRRMHGKLVLACAARRDGSIVFVRHP